MKKKLHIGTSGWSYAHWQKVFYPEDLPSSKKLRYFSERFLTAEINYSFYRLPKAETFKKWRSETPGDFIFSVKASRYITHVKKLKGVKNPWKTFFKRASRLEEKLGPVLFQFPSGFKATEENLKRLEDFLKTVKKDKSGCAFEFRHCSWCQEKVYRILKKHGAAWVISDSPDYPRQDKVTSKSVYVRMHGPRKKFASSYSEKELRNLSGKVKKWQKRGLEVFVYFNNDLEGRAVKNARTLMKMCK